MQQLTSLACSVSFREDIEVLFGPDEERFIIHKDIICPRSTLFEAACSERWSKAKTPIKLPEEDADVFNIYVYCIYKDKIEETEDESTRLHRRLIAAYLLTNRPGDVLSCNMIVGQLITAV